MMQTQVPLILYIYPTIHDQDTNRNCHIRFFFRMLSFLMLLEYLFTQLTIENNEEFEEPKNSRMKIIKIFY